MRALTGDHQSQVAFVVDGSWRLQSLQDTHPASPSFGCFHYAYWRDKTSEFPDARFQEAGATLGLLSLPFFDAARPGGRLDEARVLEQRFSAGLHNLAAQQYADGTFDEWYKGERGFAATEFTTIAYGLAARFLGDRLDRPDRDRLVSVMTRAARWLARRGDRVKANHHAAAAAALALAADVTGDRSFATAAHVKIGEVMQRQHREGWFPEVGGMDLGYCSVLLDYVMVYTLVTGDERAIPAMRSLLAFMAPLIHPDGTISPEMGICLNPYVSRLGVGLLSPYDQHASALTSLFGSRSCGLDGLRPYLADDLRLTRWSHLPLVTALLSDRFRPHPDGSRALIAGYPDGWTWHTAAAVGAYHHGRTHVYLSGAGGGTVRVYAEDRLVGEDQGVTVAGTHVTSAGYDPERPIDRTESRVSLSCDLGAPQFMQPGFWMRLALRAGSATRLGSRLTRAAIDYIRIKRRTAANQSAAPVSRGPAVFRLTRTVETEGETVRVLDRVISHVGALAADRIQTLGAAPPQESVASSAAANAVEITKTWRLADDGSLAASPRTGRA